MNETLQIIMVVLLSLVSILLILVLYSLKFKSSNKGIEKRDLSKILEESRLNTFKDLKEAIEIQNKEIQQFKSVISEGMLEAEKNNQKDLFKFLENTKEKLTELQNNFSKESSDVKEKNLSSIKDLISETSKNINELKTKILNEINETNIKNHQNVNKYNIETQERITAQIGKLKEQVETSLNKGFEKSEKAMHDFIEKAATLEAYSEKIDKLQLEIDKFSNILSNQKARGNFGEEILDQIFASIFGVASEYFYEKEVYLYKRFNIKNKKDETNIRVDFLFNLSTNGKELPIAIDAKFPYVNYIPLLEDNLTKNEREIVKKKLKQDLKVHVKAVSKYIIDGKTAPYAIMFIPSEAVFIDIFKEFKVIVDEARENKIIIASPSLIVTIIQLLEFILSDYKKRENADEILEIINDISIEFDRFINRWSMIEKDIEKLTKDIKDLGITNNKMITKFSETKKFDWERKLEIDNKEE